MCAWLASATAPTTLLPLNHRCHRHRPWAPNATIAALRPNVPPATAARTATTCWTGQERPATFPQRCHPGGARAKTTVTVNQDHAQVGSAPHIATIARHSREVPRRALRHSPRQTFPDTASPIPGTQLRAEARRLVPTTSVCDQVHHMVRTTQGREG